MFVISVFLFNSQSQIYFPQFIDMNGMEYAGMEWNMLHALLIAL